MGKIPHKIMQTWKNKNIPQKWITSPESIKKFLPHYSHTLMTDEDNRNFVKEEFPDFLPFYDNFKYPIQRADAIRYCYLYKYGGVYMDLDIELLQSIDFLFEDDHDLYFVWNITFPTETVSNCFMASIPEHPFWLDVIEEMKKPTESTFPYNRVAEILNTTGPYVVDRVLKSNFYPYKVISKDLINVDNLCHCDVHEGNIIKPLQGQSWIEGGLAHWGNYLFCHKDGFAIIIITVLALLIIFIAFLSESKFNVFNI